CASRSIVFGPIAHWQNGTVGEKRNALPLRLHNYWLTRLNYVCADSNNIEFRCFERIDRIEKSFATPIHAVITCPRHHIETGAFDGLRSRGRRAIRVTAL